MLPGSLSSMITDMNPNQLLELVRVLQPIGVSNLWLGLAGN